MEMSGDCFAKLLPVCGFGMTCGMGIVEDVEFIHFGSISEYFVGRFVFNSTNHFLELMKKVKHYGNIVLWNHKKNY